MGLATLLTAALSLIIVQFEGMEYTMETTGQPLI